MKDDSRNRLIKALRKGSEDERAAPETRAEAARQMRNQIALQRRTHTEH
jgi:hypothetical protein